MFRSLTRLGGMSASRIHLQQPALARISLASFHMGSRPNAVSVSTSTATSPSTPLPPPMAASTPKTDISSPLPSTTVNTAAPGTDAGPVTGASSGHVEEEKEENQDDTESAASTFAEFTPVSPDQARSLTQNPILSQLVNTIMKDGKKARAQRFVADALLEIRSRTQSDPYHVILDALELASPILKLTAIKKGSKVLQVPTPMTERQRRRKAIVWILEASDKRKGEKLFKDRLASEFLAVVNGNSGALVKKNQLHKMALANRANASLKY
ncbi:ribosomal protein S7 domain-containing protein [Linnemannia elongata]|nr:ribosomal protein S7 domain-containing protein [Linnemannia elongata]